MDGVSGRSGPERFCEAYYFEKKVPFHLDYATLLAHRSSRASTRSITMRARRKSHECSRVPK